VVKRGAKRRRDGGEGITYVDASEASAADDALETPSIFDGDFLVRWKMISFDVISE
jgi:hypothetical protein